MWFNSLLFMLKRFQRCILIERRAHTSNICQPIAVSICALHCFLFGWFVWFAVGLILLNYYGLELVYSCIIVFFVLFYFCPFHRGIFCHLYVWSIMGLTFASIHFYVERRRHFLSVQSDLTLTHDNNGLQHPASLREQWDWPLIHKICFVSFHYFLNCMLK